MKSSLILLSVVGGASAFAPSSKHSLNSVGLSAATGEWDEEEGKVYPTINGWTADPTKFCAGLPGAIAPLGNFDPLGFTTDLPVQEIKRFREAEVTHGRVAMLAVVGYLVQEPFHPFFNGLVTGPANTHLTQVHEIAPFFFAWLGGSIATAEFFRAKIGWESPIDAISKNTAEEFEAKTYLTKLNDKYYPGDLKFDPLGLKPQDPTEFANMQTKELNNGRLAMIAAMGMIVQEQVTHHTLF